MAVGCALACLLGAASAGPASAADDNFMTSIMRGFGLRNGNEAGIDYRERSPLVVPPKRDLPAPERAAADSNPAWPVDPEIKAKKEADALDRNTSDTFDEEARPLRPDQMTPGRKFGKSIRAQRASGSGPAPGAGDNESGRVLRPSELGSTTGLFGMFKSSSSEEEIGKFTSEPPRASLTDPPSGYQTPSAAAPYGLGKDRTPPKATDYQLEHGTQSN